MFERLGYEQYIRDDVIFYEIDNDEPREFFTIGFWLKNKTFHAWDCCMEKNVTMDEYKAITQQLNELGWLE